MENIFNDLRLFDYTACNVYLWIFKKSKTVQKYRAFYVQIDNELEMILKSLVQKEMERVTEHTPYTHLSQTNENSCLTTLTNNTNFHLLKDQINEPEPEHQTSDIKDLKGTEGYIVKYCLNGQTIYAVKRSTATWKTTYPKKFINLIFSNGELSAMENTGFSIERNFDFFCKDDIIFITNKSGFESVMQHRIEYFQVFSQLQLDNNFSNLFSDMNALILYVGNNSIQLKRMATVEHKKLYAQPNFLTNLRNINDARGWGINFDAATGKVIPCANTAKIIMQVLLDHRLLSEITENIYDVPDATKI